jgi:hypothetical protein
MSLPIADTLTLVLPRTSCNREEGIPSKDFGATEKARNAGALKQMLLTEGTGLGDLTGIKGSYQSI